MTLFGPVGPQRWGPPADGPHAVLDEPDVRRGDPFADDPDPALRAIGVGDRYGGFGTREYVARELGLTTDAIVDAARALLR